MLAAGLMFTAPIARLAGADAENIGYTCDYLKWIFLGAPFIILSNGLVHIFRSTGLIREATIGVILGNATNIVLNNSIGSYGSDAVASYGIAYKLVLFPILLSVGFSQGVAPMIGFCFGAKQYERLNNIVKYTMIDDVIFGAFFTLIFLIFSKPFTTIFLHEEALIDQSALFLRIMCLSAPMLGIINTVTAYYQALGKAMNSLVITMLRNITLFIPGVIILNALFGLNGAIASQPVVETALAMICLGMYLISRRNTCFSESRNVLAS